MKVPSLPANKKPGVLPGFLVLSHRGHWPLWLALLAIGIIQTAAAAEYANVHPVQHQVQQPAQQPAQQPSAARLVLIIDDIGNNRILGQRTVDLPGPLNLAFLPHTPFARSLAEQSHRRGHEVMLHAPMANKNGAKLGPGGLTEAMTPQQWQTTLLDNLHAIPHVSGINNHMGSLLTENPDAMRTVMTVLQQRGLFFVDSLTTPASVARQQARQLGLPSLERDIFLDHVVEPGSIRRQFHKAVTLAKQRGLAVAIGHPYPATLEVLETELGNLSQLGVTLYSARQYLYDRLWQWPDETHGANDSKYRLQPFSLPALQSAIGSEL